MEILKGVILGEDGSRSFHQHHFEPRLVGVLGDSTRNSYFFHGRRFINFENGQDYGPSEVDLGSGHVAVIATYPWEADHLEKAREMAERGARVVEPVGRILLDESEFALFGWTNGKRLIYIDDPATWEAYGRYIRFCHEHGIAIEDAAGRNALLNGREITGLDFEHTWLREDGKPLTDDERRPTIEKIAVDLQGSAHLYRAFCSGYGT